MENPRILALRREEDSPRRGHASPAWLRKASQRLEGRRDGRRPQRRHRAVTRAGPQQAVRDSAPGQSNITAGSVETDGRGEGRGAGRSRALRTEQSVGTERRPARRHRRGPSTPGLHGALATSSEEDRISPRTEKALEATCPCDSARPNTQLVIPRNMSCPVQRCCRRSRATHTGWGWGAEGSYLRQETRSTQRLRGKAEDANS